ncbi:MAG: ABC transporter permease [Deltaproteobacteria bacterium]|nr:ABC transporter permease [Deltaproteobacteria bacterium]
MSLSLALRLALRDWRAGELRLLLAALLLAVGAVTAVSLFVDRLQRALVAESATLLGADRVIDASRAVPQRFRDLAAARGLVVADVVRFPSMASSDATGRSRLASVKAVTPGYPLRGTLRVADEPFGRGQRTDGLPARGEVWLDSRLFPALGVKVGDAVAVGYAEFTVAAVLASEPDRGGGFLEFAPRLLMRAEDIPATRVIQPGSRIRYRLQVAGSADGLDSFHDAIRNELAPSYRWRDVRSANARIDNALERAESFLLLGGLLTVLLAGVAVALSARRYARRHYDHVAVLKTLGATPREVQWGYTLVLLIIGVAGALAGLILGGLAHLGIIAALHGFLPVSLPLPGARPIWVGLMTGFICVLAFGLPPLLALRGVSPMRVIRRDLAPSAASAMTYGSAAAGGLALLVWYSGNASLTAWALAGATVTVSVFAGLALLLLRGGRALGMQAGSVWRLALAGLHRRHRENVGQIVIFGVAVMLLLIMLLVRTALVDEWQARIPEHAPNHFVLNVAPAEVAPVEALLKARAGYDGRMFPMIRGRIAAVNGVDAGAWQRQRREPHDQPGEPRDGPGGRGRPGIRRERNLTFLADLPDNNVVVEGKWWSASAAPSASLEQDYAAALGLAPGDSLTFDVGGLPLTATVTNTRRVDWDSLQPNFFIILSPGALDGQAATYMTSFYLPPERRPFLNELLSRHPTVSVIDVEQIIAHLRRIIVRVAQAVELMLALVLCAGLLVLIASIQSSRDSRLKELALLRALGGTRRLITGALVAEFAALGAFAGIVAVVGAEITTFTLNRFVFELPTSLHPDIWPVGPLFGLLMVAAVGYLGTRRLVRTPPATALREV